MVKWFSLKIIVVPNVNEFVDFSLTLLSVDYNRRLYLLSLHNNDFQGIGTANFHFKKYFASNISMDENKNHIW